MNIQEFLAREASLPRPTYDELNHDDELGRDTLSGAYDIAIAKFEEGTKDRSVLAVTAGFRRG